MNPRRLLVIGGSYALAVLAAGAIMSLYYAAMVLGDVPRHGVSATGLLGFVALFGFAIGATFLVGVCAFLPARFVIAIGEAWGIRHPVFYAALAALIAVAVPLLPFFPGKGDVNALLSWSSVTSVIAGTVAGVIYWVHAGKDAGSSR